MELIVRTRIYPTESEFTVKSVLDKIYNFPEDAYTVRDAPNQIHKIIEAKASGIQTLANIHKKIRDHKIVQAFREELERNMDPIAGVIRFKLHKQALAVPAYHICQYEEESPLGPVEVEIHSPNVVEILNYLAPQTVKGVVQELPYVPKE